MDVPSSVSTAKAKDKLHTEGSEHLENLRSAGALGLKRPVRILASAAYPDSANAPEIAVGEKRVHLIRHGQGFHNLIADIYKSNGKTWNAATGDGKENNPYLRPEVVDPPLTEVGRAQARALQLRARQLSPDLVVVSTMVRATQTALIAFDHLVDGPTTKVPFLAHEGCHEIAGLHTCDKRRPASELRKDFPMIDYDVAAVPEEDSLWKEEREGPLELANRAYEFMLWLRARPQRDIVVATHSAWLFTLMNAVVECDDDHMKLWFHTGEMRSFIMRFEDGKRMRVS